MAAGMDPRPRCVTCLLRKGDYAAGMALYPIHCCDHGAHAASHRSMHAQADAPGKQAVNTRCSTTMHASQSTLRCRRLAR